MSNFSQYFPVSGGSGVGSGIPINGYFPFTVSATGNPTGYDSTTGLYTHPDGTFWVKTGNTVEDNNGTYPSATGITLAKWDYSGFSFSFFSQMSTAEGVYYDGTTFYIYSGGNSTFYTYNSSGVYSGFNFSTAALEGGTIWSFIQFNPATGTLFGNNQNNTVEFSLTGVATGFSFPSPRAGLGIDPSGNFYQMPYGAATGEIHQFDATGTATGFTFSMAPYYTSTPSGFIFHDGTSIYVSNANNATIHEWTSAGVYVGAYTMTTPTDPTGLNFKAGSLYNDNFYFSNRGSSRELSSFAASNIVTVGDSTARTDTDSAQPLFVRIG